MRDGDCPVRAQTPNFRDREAAGRALSAFLFVSSAFSPNALRTACFLMDPIYQKWLPPVGETAISLFVNWSKSGGQNEPASATRGKTMKTQRLPHT